MPADTEPEPVENQPTPDPIEDYEMYKTSRRIELACLSRQELTQEYGLVFGLGEVIDVLHTYIVGFEPPYVRLRGRQAGKASFCETTCARDDGERSYFNFQAMHDMDFAG